MSSRQQSTLIVKFTVTGLPDTSGLRIRSTSPTGLYLSSKDAAAAQWYFQTGMIQLIARRELLIPEKGGGLTAVQNIDWPAVITAGHGELIVRTVSCAEVREVQRKGSPVILPPVQKLTVGWWKNPTGHFFCMIRDEGDLVDGWLVNSVREDLSQIAIQ